MAIYFAALSWWPVVFFRGKDVFLKYPGNCQCVYKWTTHPSSICHISSPQCISWIFASCSTIYGIFFFIPKRLSKNCIYRAYGIWCYWVVDKPEQNSDYFGSTHVHILWDKKIKTNKKCSPRSIFFRNRLCGFFHSSTFSPPSFYWSECFW